MGRQHNYYVYILASWSRVLYVGVTRDLGRRLAQHREGRLPAFTARYRIGRLVYFEHANDIPAAISRARRRLKAGIVQGSSR